VRKDRELSILTSRSAKGGGQPLRNGQPHRQVVVFVWDAGRRKFARPAARADQ